MRKLIKEGPNVVIFTLNLISGIFNFSGSIWKKNQVDEIQPPPDRKDFFKLWIAGTSYYAMEGF